MVSNNGNSGIAVFPTGSDIVTAAINRVETSNNPNYGIYVYGQASTGQVKVVVNDSLSSGNGYGYYAQSEQGKAHTTLVLHGSVATSNGNGIYGVGDATASNRDNDCINSVVANNVTGISYVGSIIRIGNSTITGNESAYSGNGHTPASYGDNYVDGDRFERRPWLQHGFPQVALEYSQIAEARPLPSRFAARRATDTQMNILQRINRRWRNYAVGHFTSFRPLWPFPASLIGRLGSSLIDYPPPQCRCRSRARASLGNRHQGRSIMGSEDEVEQSLPRPRRTDDGSKRTCELTSSIVPRGTPFHRSV